MKRVLLGSCVLILTFALGFGLAPLRFINEAVGHGSVGVDSSCSFSIYSSTYFERVAAWSCSFEGESQARQFMNERKANGKTISDDSKRVLVEYDDPEHGFCSHWIDQGQILIICSSSLNHVTKFEQQFVVQKN
jgi:hypothetical protein